MAALLCAIGSDLFIASWRRPVSWRGSESERLKEVTFASGLTWPACAIISHMTR